MVYTSNICTAKVGIRQYFKKVVYNIIRGINMKKIVIFQSEVEDGLVDTIYSQSTVAYHSQAVVASSKKDQEHDIPESLRKIIAESNPNQIDLYYLESLLVSTGWNKNDDVFSPDITWAARTTPEDKQFNFMHDENDIIGHITGSYVIDQQGNKLLADAGRPDKFDIITEAVLYNSWTDPENNDRMQRIIAEIEEGKWFVSMECLFAGFDYALIDPTGNSKLVERNESSAFLTKHLRSYGGTGEYEGYKVGRALRDISFSGKGLVSKPANPRSIIFNCSKAFCVEEDDKLTKFSIGEETMAENSPLLDKQVADLKAELLVAQEENEAMKKNIEAAKDKEYADTIESFVADDLASKETIAGLEETIKAQKANMAELEDSLAQKATELAEATKAMEEWKQRERQQKRLASLIGAGFDEAEAEESLVLYEALGDEAFEAIIAKWFNKKDKKKEDKEADASETSVVELTEKPEVEIEAEVSEEIFDEVETSEAALVEATEDEDELSATRASVSEWISENILKTK